MVKTLIEAAIEFERPLSPGREEFPEEGTPFRMCFGRTAFMAGAAAMAEQFAQGQGTVLQLIRDLAEIQTRNAQLLAARIRELGNIQSKTASLTEEDWKED